MSFSHHEACPRPTCGSSDAFAVYEDGSGHCFSCGFHRFSTTENYVKGKLSNKLEEEKVVVLPEDIDFLYTPAEALLWLSKYEITKEDLKRHRVGWSASFQRLIFPYFIDNQLVAWQGRYFGKLSPKKWFSQGNIHDITYLLTTETKCDKLIVVEDIVSAVKLQKAGYHSQPLFGSSLSTKQKTGLIYTDYFELVFWLDRDKYKEAVKMANTMMMLGFNTSTICTEKDPKEIKFEEMKKLLDN